ncbi:hypothetical protein V8E52_005203 [Russula decolorans]
MSRKIYSPHSSYWQTLKNPAQKRLYHSRAREHARLPCYPTIIGFTPGLPSLQRRVWILCPNMKRCRFFLIRFGTICATSAISLPGSHSISGFTTGKAALVCY